MRLLPLAAALTLVLSAATTAQADTKTLPGFASTEKTLNDLLADGFDLKSGSAGMAGLVFSLQKGRQIAVCGYGPNERMDCMLSLEPAAARADIDRRKSEPTDRQKFLGLDQNNRPLEPKKW